MYYYRRMKKKLEKISADVKKTAEDKAENLATEDVKDKSFTIEMEIGKNYLITENEAGIADTGNSVIYLAKEKIGNKEMTFDGDIRYCNGTYTFPLHHHIPEIDNPSFNISPDAGDHNYSLKVIENDKEENTSTCSTRTAYEKDDQMSTATTMTALSRDDIISSSSTIDADELLFTIDNDESDETEEVNVASNKIEGNRIVDLEYLI